MMKYSYVCVQDKQIEKQKHEDAMKLNLFNFEKKHEAINEKIIEDQIKQKAEVLKVVQHEQLVQSEMMKKRLAERKKSMNNRSMSTNKIGFCSNLNSNHTMSMNIIGLNKAIAEDQAMNTLNFTNQL